MVSRRKILSRSRDDLNLDQTFSPQEEEEDVWYQKDKLYKEHIQEVLDKWTQIDDEIWAKVIVFERNRRVAKAYARAPVLTINGSDDGFDGMRIGLCGFDNPMRDQKTEELKKHIGQGVKIKMDDAGNILIRRYAKSNVYVKSTASNQNEETSIGADILKLPNQALESEKIVKLFDMKKFQSNVNRELRRAYPDRRRLETQCLSAVAFVKSESDILECPIWVLIVNVVAMDMLKSKLPPVQRPIVDIKNRPRIPIPDEDPYSVAGNGSGGSSGSSGFGASAMSSMMSLQQQQQLLQQQSQSMTSNNGSNNNTAIGLTTNGSSSTLQHLNNGMVAGMNGSGHVAATREQLIIQSQQLAHKRSEKPPKLPPRDNIYGHDIPKPDYDDIELDTRIKLSRGKSDKGKDNKKYDDPYYCGLRARVPNFVKTSSKSAKEQPALQNGAATQQQQQQHMNTLTNQKKTSVMMPMHPTMHAPQPPHMHPQHIQQQQMMAAVAAHAAAQQHHPMHHHHVQHAAAAAQQMWQTRSYESGIGIYNHNATATTTTAASTATATTNFNTDLQQQLQLHHQQQQQQQQLQLQQLQTASNNYYPSTHNASSSLYNYLAPNYHHQEHLLHQQSQLQLQQQQHQLVNNSSPSTASSSTLTTTTTPLSNASNIMPTTPSSLPIGHLTNTTNAIAPSASIQLSTNLTFATSPPTIKQTETNHENIYGQTRNLNSHHNPLPPLKGGNIQHSHHRHSHSHHSHQHQHQRSHHHGSYGCQMHSAHPSARSTPGEFRFKTHESFYDDYDHRHSKPYRPSRRSSSTTSQIDGNCNCVSCYTLAPLFGAPTPKRPPRSLSQQQLRQHQRLSGAKNLYKNELKRGVVKWCSDSDVSLLGREEQDNSEVSDDYRAYANRKAFHDDSFNYDDFNLDQDFDIENFTLTQLDYKKQIQKPKTQKFNGYAARHNKYTTVNDQQQQLSTDSYVDKARLRQIRSPTPQRKESSKEVKLRNPLNKPSSNLLAMRHKSQSTESFFEQPHDEGTIYLYGGRKRIVKAPSTTNLYDRIKNQAGYDLTQKQIKKYNSQLNLPTEQRKITTKNSIKNDHDTLKPLIPPPLWRGAKRMNLKASPQLNNYQMLDHNNNNINTNRQDPKICNLKRSEEINKTTTNMNQQNNKTTTTTQYNHYNADNKSKSNENEAAQQQHTQHQQQQKHMEPPPQQQQQTPYRMGRSSSRVDVSDMESIYGYLKPRKPRSLSMKKIQILDY
ncbi:Mothers against decapentaplegic like protein 2 [Lucilia cuprina]|nr:Mothers against decapentaplegic like protein 2 [Lucilia cuprina]